MTQALPLVERHHPAPGREAAASLWDHLVDFALAPGVVEAALIIAAAVACAATWWRLAALVRNAGERAALGDYLLGVEQALQGDYGGAEKRLSSVLEQDPENHYARLMLGKVLGDLGRAEQAHQQHLYLQKAFAVESGENDLLMARSLLAAGFAAESAEVAEQAMARMPSNAEGWRFVYRARLQQGQHQAAARAGHRLLSLLKDDQERRRWRSELARNYAEQGAQAWRSGDFAAASAASKSADAMDKEHCSLPLLRARLAGQQQGVAATARQLACDAQSEATSGAAPQLPAAAPASAPLRMETFSGLLETARWACRACGAPLDRELLRCRSCGLSSPAELVEPALVKPLDSPAEAMDRIDVNAAHVGRLVDALGRGEASARAELLALGDAAIPALLAAGAKGEESVRQMVVEICVEMGAASLAAWFQASDQIAQRRVWGRSDSADEVLSAALQQFGREALPHVLELMRSAQASHRTVFIDYFLGLGDLDAFQVVLERFPPMDILHQINRAPAPLLETFLHSIPRGHFLVESMLLEPTFYRDEALLAAARRAADPEVFVEVMLRRGATRSLIGAALEAIEDDEMAPLAARLLEGFGDAALEHCLAAYARPGSSNEARRRLARVLVRGGATAAAHISDSFGPEPSRSDDELRALLVVIGDEAVESLAASYERSGWLEKVSAGLVSRYNNRRVQIALALGELGTTPAIAALRSLHRREKDDNLRIHLDRSLHTAKENRG